MNSEDQEDVEENLDERNPKRYRYFEWIPARFVLYLLSLSGIMVGYIMRLIINLTILAMVKEVPVDSSFNVTETLCYLDNNDTNVQPVDYKGTLDWSLNDQFYIVSSFYWSYLLAHFVGGLLIQKFGTKKMFGGSLLMSSLCVLLIPYTSYIHYKIVVILQLLHGFTQGFAWTAIYAVVGAWIPINEKSRFTTCFQGAAIGMMLAYLMSGFIISEFGWAYVFYCTGGLGLVNSLLCYLLMYDKPEQHPRISKQELLYIQKNREQSLHSQKKIPWISILTSTPVWAIGITSFGRVWLSAIIQIYGPLYLKTIIGLPVEMNGLLLGISSFIAFLAALLFSLIADKIETHKIMPLVYNRKMFSAIGQIIPGIMAIAIGYINCNIPLIIMLWILIQLILTANFPGAMTNIVDISPSYTGPVYSVIQIVLLLPTIITTLVIKTLLQNEDAVLAWRHFFYISSVVVISTYFLYAIFGSGEVQTWDLAKVASDLGESKAKKGSLIRCDCIKKNKKSKIGEKALINASTV